MVSINDLYCQYRDLLDIELLAGAKGLSRPVKLPEAHRPGLALCGFLKGFVARRILVFGNVEIAYLRELKPEVARENLRHLLTCDTPAVIVAGKYRPPKELVQMCELESIPLFRTHRKTMHFLSQMILILNEQFAPMESLHGTLIEVFGVGVLIQGDSSIGKSEAALSLIERGHRLISDDIVRVKLRENCYLEGSGPELTRHLLEVRGIGIINVAHLYGAVCVRESKTIDLVIRLEEWDDKCFYDRVGLDEKTTEILGISIPFHVLPLKPGRDVGLLIETITLNHRLKEMGYHSAKEFNVKLLDTIQQKMKQKKISPSESLESISKRSSKRLSRNVSTTSLHPESLDDPI